MHIFWHTPGLTSDPPFSLSFNVYVLLGAFATNEVTGAACSGDRPVVFGKDIVAGRGVSDGDRSDCVTEAGAHLCDTKT